ncbi:MAG TPA: S8 family serine peptidase, partial [Thermoanaerobaculia bacterium]|nr:S8 family serine peptidase [Thermoanaerobaculia bacterium]
PIDDPGSDYVMPPIDDPRETVYASNGASATVHSCGCGAPADPQSAGKIPTPHPFISERDYSGFVIVRMAPGINPAAAESLWDLAGPPEAPKLPGLLDVLKMPFKPKKLPGLLDVLMSPFKTKEPLGLTSRPLVELLGTVGEEGCEVGKPLPLPRDECVDLIRKLEEKTAVTAFPPLHSLTSYWRLDLREHPGLVKKVVKRLNRLAEVDLAYREFAANDPQASPSGEAFADDQGYLGDAPLGIGASWAWKSLNGASAQAAADPLTICDLEQGWHRNHLEFLGQDVLPGFLYGANRAEDEGIPAGHHGTAVLGQLAAAGTAPPGVKGTAAGLARFTLASHYISKNGNPPDAGTNGHVAAAIVQALAAKTADGPLKAGDVLLLEVQRGLLPCEVDEADFEAIRLASGLGVIVIEAAGNGGFDLDAYRDPTTGRSLNRADPRYDSGAILVGAAHASLPHNRAPFSNYGLRLNCFAWGEAVTTCGFGDLAGTGAADFYTNSFNGTSSASPIIAGAAALVQILHKEKAGYLLEPRAMRDLLSDPDNGTRQGRNVLGFIGVMPDLKTIVQRRLGLVSDVYMRRHVGDDGSPPAPDEAISSSPDILVWKGTETPDEHLGEEGPWTNHPAPGDLIDPAAPNALYQGGGNNLYIRLRNRGGYADKAKVQLFASPAATLITPERWMPIGSVEDQPVVQGDTLVVAGPVSVDLPVKWPQDKTQWRDKNVAPWPEGVVPPYSFLAVQLPLQKEPYSAHVWQPTHVLPPGPPYFDWEEFRKFLRGPGVTWRNIHPILAKPDMTLAFLVTGAPDRTLHFDFEVIQRLPAGVDVTLKVPGALAAKLRQRQPWLPNGSGTFSLPHRPRTTVKQVALAPSLCAPAAFHVTVGSQPLRKGHSLAVRQLWHGEEVGRITWCFFDA